VADRLTTGRAYGDADVVPVRAFLTREPLLHVVHEVLA
jgi:hypothetical protein